MSRKIEAWPGSKFSLEVEDGPRGQGHELRIYLHRKVPGKSGRLLLVDAILPPNAFSEGLDNIFGGGRFQNAVLERALDIMRQAGVPPTDASGYMQKIMEFYPAGNPKDYRDLLYGSLGDRGKDEAEAEYREGLILAGNKRDDRGDRAAASDRLCELWRETGRAAEADALEADERRRTEEDREMRSGPRYYTVVRDGPKIGRNDSCPCGSGKKHKKCCLGKASPNAVGT